MSRNDEELNRSNGTKPKPRRRRRSAAPRSEPGAANEAQLAELPEQRGRKSRRTANTLKVIALGGMCEIGKNMYVYEYGSDMIIVDCGIAFPDEGMPGIDVVIPDFTYINENITKLRGIFLTHGHEDHIGALPWLCKNVKATVYGSKMTMALVRQKLEDRSSGVKGVNMIVVEDGETVEVGNFQVEFIHVNHSIADANALAIKTPAGVAFHSGDFKIDYTPLDGNTMDLMRIAEIGAQGALLLVGESTNVERAGHSSSESKVGDALSTLFQQAEGRIFVTTFSSNVFRIQQIFTAAENQGRKVALVGRSMLKYYEAASSLGYVKCSESTLIDISHASRYEAHQLVFITTGSQGEPLSALTRMANAEHRQVEIVKGDTVILSSSAIPGNEKSIYRVINELYRRGAHVIYESLSEIHVSGHAYQEELKTLLSLLRPKYFIPSHGEYRHLHRHAELSFQMGMTRDNVYLLKNGDVFEYSPQKQAARISGTVHTSAVLIDGSGVGDIDQRVLRDRLLLSEDGVVTVAIALNRATGEMVGRPVVQARGFIYESDRERIVKECQKKVAEIVKKAASLGTAVEDMLRPDTLDHQLQRLLYARTKRQPVLMISVIDA